MKVLNHPSYPLDLSPCDFFLFPTLKKMLSGNKYFSWQGYLSVSPTDTKRRLFICFSRLGKKVTKMCFSKGGILWRSVIKICLIKCSTEIIRTQWQQNFLQDPRSPIFIQSNLNSSNTDGSFTMANSNSFLSPYEILPLVQKNKYSGKFLILLWNCMLCVLIRIASMRWF